MRRRDFIAGLSGAAAWPVVVRAQQASRMPVIGYLNSGSPQGTNVDAVASFVRGLADGG